MVFVVETITISVMVSVVLFLFIKPSEPIQDCNGNHYVQIRTSTNFLWKPIQTNKSQQNMPKTHHVIETIW